MDVATLYFARQGLRRKGGRVDILPTGQVTVTLPEDPDFEQYTDEFLSASEGHDWNHLSVKRSWMYVNAPVRVEGMVQVWGFSGDSSRPNLGRFGYHVFEGFVQPYRRVTLGAKPSPTARAFLTYFEDGNSPGNPRTYHWVQIGSDNPDEGLWVTATQGAIAFVPLIFRNDAGIRRGDTNNQLELQGGNTFGTGASATGATLILRGKDHSSLPASITLFYGVQNTNIPDASLRVYRRGPGADSDPEFWIIGEGYVFAKGPIRPGIFASAPSNPENGQIYYDSSDHTLKVYADGEWKTLAFAE